VDPDIKALFQVLIESQTRTDKSIGELTTLFARHMEFSDARFARHMEFSDVRFGRFEEAHLRTEQAIANLSANVDKYVAAADARMLRIEENLDGLIRAITREHSNGKGHD
jgi:hypothetical protein